MREKARVERSAHGDVNTRYDDLSLECAVPPARLATAVLEAPPHARTPSRWAWALLSSSLLVASCSPVLAPIEPVKLGILNPTSGALGSLGPTWEDASRLAVEQINSAGGLFDGRRLEPIFFDTATLPNRAAEVAREALEEGAVALVGPASSGASLATIDVVAGYEVPQVSCCATSPTLTAADDWFFRTTPNDLLQAKAVAYVAAQGFEGVVTRSPCPEAAVLYRDDGYGSGLANVFIEAFEGRAIADSARTGRIVANVAYASDFQNLDATEVASDFAAQFTAAHDSGIDNVCILLVSYPDDGNAVLRALEPVLATASEDGATFTHSYLATDALFDNAFASLAGGFGLKVLGTAPTHADNKAYDTFRSAFQARFGTEPGNFTSNMYDAVMLLGLAITKSRSTKGSDIRDALFDVSREGQRFVSDSRGAFFGEMAEALLSGNDIDYVGPAGELDFDDNGDVIGDFSLWQPVPGAGGGYEVRETDFLPYSTFSP
ncbi:MAG: ABC transporter substrate-binding protein [Myxococcota bacterium]